MNLIQNFLQLSFTVLELVYRLSAVAIIFPNHLWWDRTRNSMVQKNPWSTNPTVLSPSIPMHIRTKNWNGFRTITDAILKFLSVSFMANFVPTKDIPGIPARCTAFIAALAILVQHLLPKTNASLSLMTRQPNLESSGRWMWSMSLQPATLDLFPKSSINTQLLMKHLENDLFIHTWNKAATLPLIF